VRCGGDNHSVKSDMWANNRFKAFMKARGLPVWDLWAFFRRHQVIMLSLIFEGAAKKNGQMYPSGSLMNLFGNFQRILRRNG
jgi:hypothetical protein